MILLGLYDPTNGKYHDALEENGPYLEMLKWFNDLYQDGLIDPDSMTQTYDEMIAKVQNGGTLFSIFNYSGSLGYNTKEHTSAGKLMYCMKPEDASPIVYGMNTQGGDRVWSIGAKTEYPEKCMEIINYLSTPEGRMTMEYGPKGYTWDYDDQKHAYLTDVGMKCQNDKMEDIVMCAGKEEPFKFLEDVISEVVPLFPGEYFHIGGDECPKTSWKNCPLCQKRIQDEGLQAEDGHSAEERLQSYFVQRMEKVVEKFGKKMIGWDEILEGGLAPSATVMSWRGEEGGIAAASMDHDVIMTPGGNGMYLDHFQGDSKVEPVSIGGYTTLEKTYSYNPTPDTLVAMKKDHYIKGVQANVWSEYLYNTALREYRTFPRALALSEIAWTQVKNKNYKDFERRINNAYVRLDGHNVNYHIPQPEQPNGSCNTVAFTDNVSLTFTTSRPETMVYTLDGTEPTAQSTVYTGPIQFDKTTTLKIATLLPSGKLSRTRTILVDKQELAPAKQVAQTTPGLNMQVTDGYYLNTRLLKDAMAPVKETKVISETRELTSYVKTDESMRGVNQYAAVATGYVNIPEDGVYYFSSDLEEVWIDGKLLINNANEVKRFSRNDNSVALAKGLHEIKAVFLGHIIGGWPSNWNDGSINIRKSDAEKFTKIDGKMLCH